MKTNMGEDDTPQVDMAAMMDCIFLLLIFFLVAATIRKKHNELSIEIPSNFQVTAQDKPDNTLIIKVVKAKGGEVQYALASAEQPDAFKTAGSLSGIGNLINEAATVTSDRNVIIKGSNGVSYGKVAEVVDLLRSNDMSRINLDIN